MTIKEIENATGMTRANIRFYEAEGLITPKRHDNGYREYCKEHAEILLRIKLLRCLQMSLEDIKKLQTGEADLLTALDRQIAILTEKQAQLENSRRVCREMREDGVTYNTLDAKKYLNSMNNGPSKAEAVLIRDVKPRIYIPWRRFWARWLDSLLGSMTALTMLMVLSDGVIPNNFWTTVLGLGLSLLLEPIQLRIFGTTLGKWIFGIRLLHRDGRKLDLGEAFRRTWQARLYGEALGIPFVCYWRLWKSYKTYNDGYELPWEEDSEMTCSDVNPWRYAAAAGAALLIFGLTVGGGLLSTRPDHRGDLTVEQFCENYNQIMDQQGVDFDPYYLTNDGTWEEYEQTGAVYVYIGGGDGAPLDFVFTTENGTVTSVSLSTEITGDPGGWLGNNGTQVYMAILALVRAQPGYNILEDEAADFINSLTDTPFSDYDVTISGVRIRCDYEYSGYYETGMDMLVADEDASEYHYSMDFTMELTQ